MIISIDTETQGLNPNPKAFILGVINYGNKTETYYNPKEMLNKIINYGNELHKQRKTLIVYAHNTKYDLFALGLKLKANKNLKIKNLGTPFMIEYTENQWQNGHIFFYDTMGLMNTGQDKSLSLETLGKIIGNYKTKTPEKLKKNEKQTYTQKETEEIEKYCKQDTQIVYDFVIQIKNELAKQGLKPRKIITMGQIGINYLTNEIRKKSYWKKILCEDLTKSYFKQNRGKFWRTRYENETRKAYKGARIENYGTGQFENTTYIDANSLYPYCATITNFPDLTTERLIKKPLDYFKKEELLNKYGLSRVLIWQPKNKIGLIMTLQNGERKSIKNESYCIGSYTHNELKHYEKEGAKIIDIEYSIIWETLPENPLSEIMKDLYKKRKTAKKTVESHLYKGIMNKTIGKLAQKRTEKTYYIGNVEEHDQKIKDGWKVESTEGTTYVYKKETKEKPAKWFTLIIPAYINAQGRIETYNTMKKIGEKNLLYCATDGILFTGETPKTIKIGTELGEYKETHKNKTATIYGKQTYAIEEDIRISGPTKGQIKQKDFEKGKIEYQKMITTINPETGELQAEFKTETRDLIQELENKEEPEEKELYIDENEKDLNYFFLKIKDLCKNGAEIVQKEKGLNTETNIIKRGENGQTNI